MSTFNQLAAAALLSFPLLVNAATVGIGTGLYYTPTLADNLASQGHTVTVVDTYDAATLAGFDFYIQDGNSHFDGAALDTYVAGGGTLIALPWSFTHHFGDLPRLAVIGPRTEFTHAEPNPGVAVLAPSDPVLAGSELPEPGTLTIGREVGNAFAPDATQVLAWDDGTALLGYKHYGMGTIVAFNVHLITSDSSPIDAQWSNRIMYNIVDGAIPAVPEPATCTMLGLGALTLSAMARRRVRTAK